MEMVHDIPARAPWSGIIRKGQTLRIEDTYGQQAIDTLFYNADDHGERYSSQDTLRAQGAAYVTTGTAIMSNLGRLMLRVTADSAGRHDTSAGCCSCEATRSVSAMTRGSSMPAARISSLSWPATA
jgi:uncharacterized protein